MLFMIMLETLDFMRISGINNNINKLFTLALSGWKQKIFEKFAKKVLTNVYTSGIMYIQGKGTSLE